MAASLGDVKVGKRTIGELEDITNTDRYHKTKKMKMNMKFQNMYFERDDEREPQQQRSPSPSDLSSLSPTKPRTKSVSFELAHNKQYENSPLLTPKDEDDDYNEDSGAGNDGQAAGDNEHGRDDGQGASLGTNCDYLALTSSLRLLTADKDRIESEIVGLSQMLDFHANNADKDQIIDFFSKLVDNKLHLPKQSKILRCPLIEWSKYHNGLANVNKESFAGCGDEKLLFKTLNLFNSK